MQFFQFQLVNMCSNMESESGEIKFSVGENVYKDHKGVTVARKHSTSSYTCSMRENRTSEVFAWGSNSSYQLGEAGPDRLMSPKLANTFTDVESVMCIV